MAKTRRPYFSEATLKHIRQGIDAEQRDPDGTNVEPVTELAIESIPGSWNILLAHVKQQQHAMETVRRILETAYKPQAKRKELAAAAGFALDAIDELFPPLDAMKDMFPVVRDPLEDLMR